MIGNSRLLEYTIHPEFMRVKIGHMENEPDTSIIGIEVHDRRGRFTIPLPATDAAVTAKLLMMLANELRERDGMPAYAL